MPGLREKDLLLQCVGVFAQLSHSADEYEDKKLYE